MHKFRKAFDFLRKDKIMKSLIDKVGNDIRIDDRNEKDLALAIALLVIEQQVSFKAAITVKKRFRNIINNKNYENIIKME